jgi:hypothetical protein
VIDASLFLGFGDLRNVVDGPVGADQVDELADRLAKTQRTTRLSSFTNRLPDNEYKSIEQKGKWPVEEFICLMALALEVDAAGPRERFIDKAACENALRAGKWLGFDTPQEFIDGVVPGMAKEAKDRVSGYLGEILPEEEMQ